MGHKDLENTTVIIILRNGTREQYTMIRRERDRLLKEFRTSAESGASSGRYEAWSEQGYPRELDFRDVRSID